MQVLRQEKLSPLAMHTQVILLNVVLGRLIDAEPQQFRKIAFETADYIEKTVPALCERIETTGVLSDEDKEEILRLAADFIARTYGK